MSLKEPVPDFSLYSDAELEDIARYIDGEQYPENYAAFLAELEKRGTVGGTAEQVESDVNSCSGGCVGYFLWVVGCGLCLPLTESGVRLDNLFAAIFGLFFLGGGARLMIPVMRAIVEEPAEK